jgi:hypothetical protein
MSSMVSFGADLTKVQEQKQTLTMLGVGTVVGAGVGLFYGRTLLGGALGLGATYLLLKSGALGALMGGLQK